MNILIILFLLALIVICVMLYSVVPYIVDNYKSQNILYALLKYMNSHKNISILILSIFVIIVFCIKCTFYGDNVIPLMGGGKHITIKEQSQYEEDKLKQYETSEDGTYHNNMAIPDSDIKFVPNNKIPEDLSTNKPQGATDDFSKKKL